MNVTLRAAITDHLPGVRTFYLTSLTTRGKEYTLKVIRRVGRRTITCTCENYVHDAGPRGVACKHVTLLRDVIRRVGGVSRIPAGARVTAPVERSHR